MLMYDDINKVTRMTATTTAMRQWNDGHVSRISLPSRPKNTWERKSSHMHTRTLASVTASVHRVLIKRSRANHNTHHVQPKLGRITTPLLRFKAVTLHRQLATCNGVGVGSLALCAGLRVEVTPVTALIGQQLRLARR